MDNLNPPPSLHELAGGLQLCEYLGGSRAQVPLLLLLLRDARGVDEPMMEAEKKQRPAPREGGHCRRTDEMLARTAQECVQNCRSCAERTQCRCL
jgi:hypothetical protein